MEDLLAWESDPLAFKVMALAMMMVIVRLRMRMMVVMVVMMVMTVTGMMVAKELHLSSILATPTNPMP